MPPTTTLGIGSPVTTTVPPTTTLGIGSVPTTTVPQEDGPNLSPKPDETIPDPEPPPSIEPPPTPTTVDPSLPTTTTKEPSQAAPPISECDCDDGMPWWFWYLLGIATWMTIRYIVKHMKEGEEEKEEVASLLDEKEDEEVE